MSLRTGFLEPRNIYRNAIATSPLLAARYAAVAVSRRPWPRVGRRRSSASAWTRSYPFLSPIHSPCSLLLPRAASRAERTLAPSPFAPAVPRRSARFRRAQSRTTSPSTSSYPSRARLTRSLAESASRPPGAIAAPRRSSAISSSFPLRPSSVQIESSVSFLATHSSSPSLSPSVPAMPPPV